MLEHWLDVLHWLLRGLPADLPPRCRRIEDGFLRDEMRELLLSLLGREVTAYRKVRELIHPQVDRSVEVRRRRHVASAHHGLLMRLVADCRQHFGREREIDLDHLEPELV